VAEALGPSTAPAVPVAFAAEVSTAFITEASEAFMVAEALAASAVTRTSTDSILTSGRTGARTPIGTDMAHGGGLTITLHTTTLTLLTTLRLIVILVMIVVIGTIAAIGTIAIPTTGVPTVLRTLPNQAAKILPRSLRIRLVPKALLTGIT